MGRLVTEWIYKTPARIAAQKLSLNRKTVNLWYSKIRQGILEHPDESFFDGIVEVDETYLSDGIAGRPRTATADKVAVFGIYSRKTKRVFATVVQGTSAEYLLPHILNHVSKGSTIHSDLFGAYYYLKAMGYTHRAIPHGYTYSLGYGVHSNSIESFWRFLQDSLRGKRGLKRSAYQTHVQEAVFLFNHQDGRGLRLLLKKFLDFRV
jgi:transposase-like protein